MTEELALGFLVIFLGGPFVFVFIRIWIQMIIILIEAWKELFN